MASATLRPVAIAAVAAAAMLAIAAAPVLAQAERWPARPVRIVVPSPPGSGLDLVSRSIADRLAARWGEAVVVENKPGANSIIGSEAVARAAPDGYTLLLASDSAFTVNPHLYATLPYDPQRDFAPVAQVATLTQLLAVNESLGVRTLAELVDYARAHPDAVTYASFGNGSSAHLLSELLQRRTGTRFLQVPYKGFTQAIAAVASGEAMIAWSSVYSLRPLVEAGRARALAIAAPSRSPYMPDVPTMRELGYEAFEYYVWFGLFAPAATPRAVVERIHRDVMAILAEREFRDRELLARGYEPSTFTPDQFGAFVRKELAERASLVKSSGARAQ